MRPRMESHRLPYLCMWPHVANRPLGTARQPKQRTQPLIILRMNRTGARAQVRSTYVQQQMVQTLLCVHHCSITY